MSHHPAWYYNLVKHPAARVQIGRTPVMILSPRV
jgi:hypothetical protein